MINQDIVIAKKYAQAFINIYGNALDTQMIEALEKFTSFIKSRHRVLFYMHLAFIPQETIKKTVHTLLSSYNLTMPITALVDLLIEQKRIYLLPAVITRIISLYKESHNSMDFIIASSHELSSEQLDELRAFLEQKTAKKINYKTVIDKRLIAGIKMYSDTFYWEHSIRKQLNGLSTLKN